MITAFISKTLLRIESIGNRLPHPSFLFIYLCGFILLLSALSAWLNVAAVHPITHETINAVNLLNQQGLHRILNNTVTNFTHFAPVGSVLIAMMGIGVAEHSGLLDSFLRATILNAPKKLLSFFIVLAGVLSSLAVDTGYVVLIPLAAAIFLSAGRHPIVGIAAAFAGVSGGFSANLIIGPFDAILGGISTEAAALVKPGYQVTAAANYYFLIASTFLIALVGAWITENIVAPQLGEYQTTREPATRLSSTEKNGLKAVGIFTLAFITLLLLALLPADGILRDPSSGNILNSPFIQGIVTIIAFYAAISGFIFGKVTGKFANSRQFIEGMENSMTTMASYLVLMFFAAQFVSYFSWSQLGTIASINGAIFIKSLQLDSSMLVVCFIALAAIINLLIGSGSAKWALIAPIFVPIFLLVGISPEATQMAFRIGDSSTNIITPLMPYFGVVVAFVQKYDQKAGIGSIVAMMLPYSVALLIGWTALLLVWIALDWPLGPGAAIFLNLES